MLKCNTCGHEDAAQNNFAGELAAKFGYMCRDCRTAVAEDTLEERTYVGDNRVRMVALLFTFIVVLFAVLVVGLLILSQGGI